METKGGKLFGVYFITFIRMVIEGSGVDKSSNHYTSGLRDEPLEYFCFYFCFYLDKGHYKFMVD